MQNVTEKHADQFRIQAMLTTQFTEITVTTAHATDRLQETDEFVSLVVSKLLKQLEFLIWSLTNWGKR